MTIDWDDDDEKKWMKIAAKNDRRLLLQNIVNLMNERKDENNADIIYYMGLALGITECSRLDCSNFTMPGYGRKWCSEYCKTAAYRERKKKCGSE